MAKITGRDRMRKVLKALPDAVRNQIRKAILDASKEMADTMRNLAPFKTGALRKSIVVTPASENLPAYASLKSKVANNTDPELAAIITAGSAGTREEGGVRYAHLVEFGTAPHINQGQFPGTQNPGAPAQPFFFPGYRARKKSAIAKINRAARQGIKDGLK